MKRRALFVELAVLAVLLYMGWRLRVRNLTYVVRISEVLLLAVLLKVAWRVTALVELSVEDLAGLACCMVLNHVLLSLFHANWYASAYVAFFSFLVLAELLVLVRGIHGRKRGYGVSVGYGILCCFGVLAGCKRWEWYVLNYYYAREREFGYGVKGLYLLVCGAFLWAVVFLAVGGLGILLKRWLVLLQEYSVKYGEIDFSILLVVVLTLCTLSVRELVRLAVPFLPMGEVPPMAWFFFWPVAEDTYEIPLLWLIFSVLMAMIQVIYLRLLVKSISAKEKMGLQERELHQLAEYNRELERNVEDMRGIRHDIKNMFLTMGGFVDRSGDGEMKAFYEENLVPFAKQELRKNELYGKLACIHSEGLKSFLYFKIMQGIEQDVSMDLVVELADGDGILGMEQADLIRILGILVDNGIEEAVACRGAVGVSLRETQGEYFFSISNTVRPQTREKGVVAGTTEKGLGRGNGLLIVEKLMRKYRNVLLNSFFRDGEFVQCLRIEK